jgi:hypothetical protein
MEPLLETALLSSISSLLKIIAPDPQEGEIVPLRKNLW